jgi:hypothetical protein
MLIERTNTPIKPVLSMSKTNMAMTSAHFKLCFRLFHRIVFLEYATTFPFLLATRYILAIRT